MKSNRKKKVLFLLIGTIIFSISIYFGQSELVRFISRDFNNDFEWETEFAEVEIEDEMLALAETPISPMYTMMPEASGTLEKKNKKAQIDYSNTLDGYVMVKFVADSTKKIKAQVKGPSENTYTYNLTAGASSWTTFPLSDENGEYKVTVFENVNENKYATVLSVKFSVSMEDPFAPFLRPNQYVNYEVDAKNTVAKAAELFAEQNTTLDKIRAAYEFVVTTLTYDTEKAATVQSGYLPVLDKVLSEKKGICFDYAAMLAGMLRSQGIPCKLIVGYAGSVYHSWINVYTEESGWINSAIYFDGYSWKLMDPTFASSGNQSAPIMKYIGDSKNYKAMFIY